MSAIVVWIGSGVLLGLASAPHCLGMCGPLAVAVSAGAKGAGWRSPAAYQVGRTLSYAILGAVAGGLGARAADALDVPWARAGLSWAMALAFAFAAWGLWRSGRGRESFVQLRLQRFDGSPRRSALVATTFGALSALLPCGALWAALLVAATSGSAIHGAALLFGFVAASGVALFLASIYAQRLTASVRRHARVLAAVCIVAAVVLAARPVKAIFMAPKPTASCCAMGEHP
ncbi:MAG: sulfite exporter TauE/SafE family protein [Myxococcales bacterium]|nr:sulfite exporter TauE/SafE family protein [Myxococcales bacterium]